MEKSRIVAWFFVVLFLVSGTGCALYSVQEHGGLVNADAIRADDNIVDAVKKLGSPDAVYETTSESIYVWNKIDGRNFLGVYSDIEKYELVAVVKNGVVTNVHYVNSAESMSILGPISPVFEVE